VTCLAGKAGRERVCFPHPGYSAFTISSIARAPLTYQVETDHMWWPLSSEPSFSLTTLSFTYTPPSPLCEGERDGMTVKTQGLAPFQWGWKLTFAHPSMTTHGLA
jgi:hypothetical protein